MKKIIIWGTGAGYDEVMLHLKADIMQGKIQIVALVSSYKELISYLDGKKIILPEEIKNYEFDYIIIANAEYDEEIKESAIRIGIDNKKIIGYRVISNNLFDFDRYINILESNISIVSDDCWGGYVYNTLNLQFNSPFINLAVYNYYESSKIIYDDYYKLVSNIEYYLKQPLEMIRESNGCMYPEGSIGDVKLSFIHYRDFNEAKECWDKRVKRFNLENYIIKKTITDDEDAKRFSELPMKNKIGFYNKELNLEGIVCLKNYEKSIDRKDNLFRVYVRSLAMADVKGLKEYDIFKLLSGEKNFLRGK
jgi:uncharacterized protein (DUF1919 family)